MSLWQNILGKVTNYANKTLGDMKNNPNEFGDFIGGALGYSGPDASNLIQNIGNKNWKGVGDILKGGMTGIKSIGSNNIAGLAEQGISSGLSAFGVKSAQDGYFTTEDKVLDNTAKYIGMVPGVGWAASAALKGLNLINKHAGKSIDKQNTVGMDTGSYGTSVHSTAGQKASLWSRISGKTAKQSRSVAANEGLNLLGGNATYQQGLNRSIASNTSSVNANKNLSSIYGQLQGAPLLAKKGTKLPPSYFKNIVKRIEEKPKNVIPEGAFHSRKHNLPEEIAEHVTHKGIPVVTKDGDEIIQQAEIERRELIFHKEATNKIEKFLEQYNNAETNEEKDEIAIKCGRFVSNEILFNTEDNANLIESVK